MSKLLIFGTAKKADHDEKEVEQKFSAKASGQHKA